MIKEELFNQLFNKIPQHSRVAIFGASTVGGAILKDILIHRKDIEVLCFIDNNKSGYFWDIPIYGLKEFIDKNLPISSVIISSLSAQTSKVNRINVNNVFDVYDIPYIPINQFIFNIYSATQPYLNDKMYDKILGIFKYDEDKKLFEYLFKARMGMFQEIGAEDKYSAFRKYYKEHYPNIYPIPNTIKHHYLDRINQEKVKTVFDVGFNSGFNAIAYQKLLPNYNHSYAFEAIYETCRDKQIEEFILNDTITFINYAVGDKKCKTKFYIYENETGCSFADISQNIQWTTPPSGWRGVEVNVIKLDDFCKENNVYPDLIKMDIEGGEMCALRGGIEAIKKSRPQLAISIYHSDKDFVDIPVYLYDNLEDYIFKLGHYSPYSTETIIYAIPKEIDK